MSQDVVIQPFPPFGLLATVSDTHWSAIAGALRSYPQLAFDTGRYPYFDRVIAEAARKPPLYNTLQREYPLYAGLRFNIAALRNHLATSMLGSSFTINDKKRVIPRLQNIAGAIGEAIASGEISPHATSVEGAGAAEIYDYLLYIQDQPGLSPKLRALLRRAMGRRQLNFSLPPRESTPFSPANLAPPVVIPSSLAKLLGDRKPNPDDQQMRSLQKDAERLAEIGEQMLDVALALDNVEDMAFEPKAESVEEAKKILRWLRNLQATDRNVEEWLDLGTPQAMVAKAEKLQQIVNVFVQLLQRQKDMASTSGSGILEAIEAIRAISIFISEHAVSLLPESHKRGKVLDQVLDELPDHWEKRAAQPVRRLLDLIEGAIERLSGIKINEQTVGERLAAASASLNKNLDRLRKVDTMGTPAREESVELAREILDKLRNASFNKKSPKEMIEAKPEEKLAMVEKLDEGVEAYANLVNEAARANPQAPRDKRITDATDAAACFSHAVALMAAKEMPGSVAAAQQISAEAARDPEEWKNLKDHTVERLTQSMEGGVEKAASDVAAEQEQQQQEEQGQEAAQQAQEASDNTRRKRRKRRAATKGTGKARKQQVDLTADDFVLKQGRFREDAPSVGSAPQPTIALKQADMAAIKEVAGSLRTVSEDAKPNMAMTSVAPDEKIAPDDKSQATRFSEREQQSASKPIAPGKRN